MPLRIVDSEAPITDADIKEVEADLQVRLPDDYRAFLLRHNGGEFEDEVDYPLLDPPSRGTGGFRYFYSIIRDDDGEIGGLDEPPDTNIDGLIAIAEDETGFICLACGPNDNGRVYYVDFDRGLPKWMCLVANSFTEFLDSISVSGE